MRPLRPRDAWWALCGLVVLHVVATWTYSWSTGRWAASLARLHPDLIGLLAVACVLGLRRGFRSWVGHAVVAVLLWVALFRLAASVTEDHFGRQLDLYEDVLFTADGLWVYMTGDVSRAVLWSVLAAGMVAAGLVWWGLYAAARAVLRCAACPAGAVLCLGLGQLAFVVYWLEGSRYRTTRSVIFAGSEIRDTAAQLGTMFASAPWRDAEAIADRRAAAEAERSGIGVDLGGLQGAHVAVIFVESYGRVVHRLPGTRARFAAAAPEWTARLAAAGFAACSAYTTSPVFGGNSHVAHGTFLAGIPIESKSQFEALLRTDMQTMAHFFAAAGYHTVNAQPKLMQEWPQGRFFGFARDFFGTAADYAAAGGERYHWADGPDQFYLQHLLEMEIRPRSEPTFVQFISTTSHAPFKWIPPYHDDWRRAADARNLAPAKRYDLDHWNYLQRPEHTTALVDTLVYSMDTTVGFARELARDGRAALVIVLGDHQPPAMQESRRTLDVPIHVLANRPELLQPFRRRGFGSGLLPPADGSTPSFPMHRFLARLLRDFRR